MNVIFLVYNMRMFISDAPSHIGTSVQVKGWVYNSRSSGSIVFLEVRDGVMLMLHHGKQLLTRLRSHQLKLWE